MFKTDGLGDILVYDFGAAVNRQLEPTLIPS